MGHTRGNWKSHQTIVGSVFVTTDDDSQMEIASIFGDTKDQARANALLIAASPKLLEACINAFATIEIDLGHIDLKRDREALMRIKSEIRAAIIMAGYIDPQIDITL